MFSKIKEHMKLFTLLLLLSFSAVPLYAATELNLPNFSPLGKEIANGRAVYSDNFYWIDVNGNIGSTNRGWSRVPKENRNLVYLSMRDAQTALDEYTITDEERAEQIRKAAEEKAEQIRKEAEKIRKAEEEKAAKIRKAEEERQIARKQQKKEEEAAKKLQAYQNKCEEGASDDPFAAFNSQDTNDRMKLTVKYGGDDFKLQANEEGCLWQEDSSNINILPSLVDSKIFQQNPNNSSQFVVSVTDGSLILDFSKFQCLSRNESGTTQILECYDSASTPKPTEKKVAKTTVTSKSSQPSPAPKPKKSKPPPPPAPSIMQVSCSTLNDEFEVNEMRAIRKYRGKDVIITGRVTSIDADFYDNAQINLSTGDEWGFGSCTLSPPTNNQDFAYDLDKGQYVKLKCKGINEVMGSPTASSCKLVN